MSEARCQHGMVVCSKCVVVTDAAKRMSDVIGRAVLSHAPEELAHGWMAFRLDDGSSDHVLYPSKKAAVEHQANEFYCAYICLAQCLGSMPVKDAQIWLNLHRHLYSHGVRISDPDERSAIMPVAREQRISRLTWR